MARREDPHGTGAATASRLGFLISDGAGTVIAVQDAIERGDLPGCSIAIVACNVTGAPGVEAARACGLRTVTLEGRGREQRDHEDTLHALLQKMGVDVICLSGYLRVLSRDFIRRWPQRILTMHSSLLPAFPGARPERQALDFGAQITGCTVSLLDDSVEAMNGGPIVVQRALRILDNDTEASLAARLLPEEHDACIEAIRRVVSGQYELQGRRYLPRAATTAKPVGAVSGSAGVSASGESASGKAGSRTAGSAPGR